jgi:N utilization substance protein B
MSVPPRPNRHEARRHAFRLIFQFPYHSGWGAEELAAATANYYDGLEREERPRGRDAAYILRTVTGTLERCAQLDGVISQFLKEWTTERLNRVDLALMRLAIYEMLNEKNVSPAVAINEAVELAKEYGSDESPAFINGVLANVSRALEGGGLV